MSSYWGAGKLADSCCVGYVKLTKSSVAVLAHIPKATVLTSHLIAFMTSKMAMVAYGDPPANHPHSIANLVNQMLYGEKTLILLMIFCHVLTCLES